MRPAPIPSSSDSEPTPGSTVSSVGIVKSSQEAVAASRWAPFSPWLVEDIQGVLQALRFPAWVLDSEGCLFHNARVLDVLGSGFDLGSPIEASLATQPEAQNLRVIGRQGSKVTLSLNQFETMLAADAGTSPRRLRIVVASTLEDAAQRDTDLLSALWKRLLGENPQDPESTLPDQQRRVFRLLSQGFTYKEIAAQLGVAHATVRVQVAGLRKRLGSRRVPTLRKSNANKPI